MNPGLAEGIKRRLRLGISARITLLWVALFMGGLVLFATLAEAAVKRELLEALDGDLAAAARGASIGLASTRQIGRNSVSSNVAGLRVFLLRRDRPVRYAGGQPPRRISQLASQVPVGHGISTGAGNEFRIYVLAAGSDTRVVAIAPQSYISEDQKRVRYGFLAAAVPVLIFVGLAGWLLARRSLRPIDKITAVAVEIAQSGSPSTRLNLHSRDELGRLAKAFDEMLEQLERSFARERSFIGDVSHELRNSIGTIIAEGEHTLSRERDAHTYKAAVSTMLERARRIATSVHDLLLLARADAGILKTSQQADVNDIVTQVCADLQRRGDGRRIVLDLSGESLLVAGSPELLARLFSNVISNGRQFAKTRVRVQVRHDSRSAIVIVEDDGAGVPVSERESIFRRFYRGEARYAGSGLGLPIAAAVATSCGGSIVVGDSEHGGAKFITTLPLADSRMS